MSTLGGTHSLKLYKVYRITLLTYSGLACINTGDEIHIHTLLV